MKKAPYTELIVSEVQMLCSSELPRKHLDLASPSKAERGPGFVEGDLGDGEKIGGFQREPADVAAQVGLGSRRFFRVNEPEDVPVLVAREHIGDESGKRGL